MVFAAVSNIAQLALLSLQLPTQTMSVQLAMPDIMFLLILYRAFHARLLQIAVPALLVLQFALPASAPVTHSLVSPVPLALFVLPQPQSHPPLPQVLPSTSHLPSFTPPLTQLLQLSPPSLDHQSSDLVLIQHQLMSGFWLTQPQPLAPPIPSTKELSIPLVLSPNLTQQQTLQSPLVFFLAEL
jgi:hypothetical protein